MQVADTEIDLFIAADGTTYKLGPLKGRNVLRDEGSGMPPVEHITQRGPFQDGETLHRVYLRPRTVQYFIRNTSCSRDDYWLARSGLLDAIRPNRGLAGILRKIFPGNVRRDLTVTILEGPKFEPRGNDWDEFSFQEMLRFIAYDPLYFNPVAQIATIEHQCIATAGGFPYIFPFLFDAGECQLIFPITFPITFDTFNRTYQINYIGNWEDFPTIRVTGPSSSCVITNTTTGKVLEVIYSLAAGEYYDINLAYGYKTITKNDGANLLAYLDDDSDLTDWSLEPGVNNLTITMLGASASSVVTITYYERYLGI